jgi:hypothetical protein
MMKVAMFGRAVSPVTSYVAYEPGVRPSTIGFLRGTGAGSGFGSGHGGLRGASITRRKVDFSRLVETESCVKSVRPTAPWEVLIHVETTKDEVVDVEPSTQTPMALCLSEIIWAVRLDKDVFSLDREDFTVQLSGPAAP